MSNLKKPACASKRDVLELATLRYVFVCKTNVVEAHFGKKYTWAKEFIERRHGEPFKFLSKAFSIIS